MKDARAHPSRVEVLSTERLVDDFIKVDRVRLRFERYDGRMSDPITRLVVDRGHAVAVLPYDSDGWRVILVEQFRYPTYVAGSRGWLWEVIAGVQDGEPEEVARREAWEEARLHLGPLQRVLTAYSSPGSLCERLSIYLAPISIPAEAAGVAGLLAEGEGIMVGTFTLDEALDMVGRGEICDAKTVIALQYLALHREDLPGAR